MGKSDLLLHLQRVLGIKRPAGRLPYGMGLVSYASIPAGPVLAPVPMVLAASPPIVRAEADEPDSKWTCIGRRFKVVASSGTVVGPAIVANNALPLPGDLAVLKACGAITVRGDRVSRFNIGFGAGFEAPASGIEVATAPLVQDYFSHSREGLHVLPGHVLMSNIGEGIDERNPQVAFINSAVAGGTPPCGNTLAAPVCLYLFMEGVWVATSNLPDELKDPRSWDALVNGSMPSLAASM